MNPERVTALLHVPLSANGMPERYIDSLVDFLSEEDPSLNVIFPQLLPCGVIMLLHGEPRARACWRTDNPLRRNLSASLVSPLLMFFASLGAAGPAFAGPHNAAASSSTLPLVFEENRGQADPRVRFLARGAEYVLFITAAEAVLADRRTGQAVRVHLRGARPDVEVAGLEPLPGRIHYIRGRDHAAWRTGVATKASAAMRRRPR